MLKISSNWITLYNNFQKILPGVRKLKKFCDREKKLWNSKIDHQFFKDFLRSLLIPIHTYRTPLTSLTSNKICWILHSVILQYFDVKTVTHSKLRTFKNIENSTICVCIGDMMNKKSVNCIRIMNKFNKDKCNYKWHNKGCSRFSVTISVNRL